MRFFASQDDPNGSLLRTGGVRALFPILLGVAACAAPLDAPIDENRQDDFPPSAVAKCNQAPQAPPAALELDPFYQKYVDASGIPILSSAAVSDQAFVIACETVTHMLSKREDIREALQDLEVRVGIIAEGEVTTDMPEHRNLDTDFPRPNGESWDERTRGVGATAAAPLASVGEENLLGLASDRYRGQSILVHEFGHTVFDLGVVEVDPDKQEELRAAFERATAIGLYNDSYASTNAQEYWAEGVQSWYHTNPNVDKNPVVTRDDLMAMDPDLAILIGEVFPDDGFQSRTAGQE